MELIQTFYIFLYNVSEACPVIYVNAEVIYPGGIFGKAPEICEGEGNYSVGRQMGWTGS